MVVEIPVWQNVAIGGNNNNQLKQETKAINVAFLRLRCAAPLRREWPDSLLSSGFPDMFEVSNEGNREVLLLAKQ